MTNPHLNNTKLHTTVPANPLVDQHTIDTLIHIQAVLSFLQEYVSKTTEESDFTLNDVRVNTGHYALLKLVNDALDYEIHRLDQAGSTAKMN
jgi:hypothetical protein